jgi:putative two-component system response regulator
MDIMMGNILIVDDQEYNVSLLERILGRAGFKNVFSTMDSLQVERLLGEVEPDIVLLDLHMPDMDGLAIMRMLQEKSGPDDYLPVLMLTADLTTEARQQGLQAGVNDFLTKPYDRTEVILRITNLLRTRFLHRQLLHYNNQLEEKVKERTKKLEQAQLEILQLLGRAAEYRDDMTGHHTQRVGDLSGVIAERLGLPQETTTLIRLAAPLHDIGKIGIPDGILLKPGRFEPDEFERMKSHTTIGCSILDGSSFGILRLAQVIAMSHHEKWDGSGYPQGLQGEEIPIEARIVALADFYDALTHERPYKRAWTPEETMAEIVKQRGKHFDPQIVDAFIAFLGESIAG